MLLDFFVFALPAFAVSAVLFYPLGTRRGAAGTRARLKTPYWCACGHSISSHRAADHSGPCVEQYQRPHYAEHSDYPLKKGDRRGNEWATCPCTGYVGDRPLSLADINSLLRDDT